MVAIVGETIEGKLVTIVSVIKHRVVLSVVIREEWAQLEGPRIVAFIGMLRIKRSWGCKVDPAVIFVALPFDMADRFRLLSGEFLCLAKVNNGAI